MTSASSASLFVNRPVISDQAVLRGIGAALEQARALGIDVSVAIADSSGQVVGFIKMVRAFGVSRELAKKKAISAAGLGFEADVAEQILSQEAPRVREGLLQQPDFSLIHGGLPIRVDGELIGAIGVSGGSEAQDVSCATAGLNVILKG